MILNMLQEIKEKIKLITYTNNCLWIVSQIHNEFEIRKTVKCEREIQQKVMNAEKEPEILYMENKYKSNEKLCENSLQEAR